MDFIYGVIYYLLLTLLVVTCLLPLFLLKCLRRHVFGWARRTDFVHRLNLFGNLPFAVLVLMVYVVVDSFFSFWGKSTVIKDHGLDYRKLPHSIMNSTSPSESVQLFRDYKEYHIAECNLLLTLSCLLVAYTLRKFVLAIDYLSCL